MYATDPKSLLPVDPEVSAREEAGDGVPADVVQPALAPQLPHAGVNPRVARLALQHPRAQY